MQYIDTHIHLNDDRFREDFDQVLERAKGADVGCMITPGTDLQSSRESMILAEKHAEIYAAVGVHPHEAAKTGINDLAEIERMVKHLKVVAIGEIGLDYYYDFSPQDVQRSLFKIQLKMAKRLNVPVIIHVRDAMQDTFKVIDAAGQPPWQGVFHCFGGTKADIPGVLDRGFHISFTGVVTFKNFEHADAVRSVPLDRLLLETDAPYMTPVPHRGKRNEPMFLVDTASWIANARNISLETLAQATTSNARSLFGLER